MPQRRIVARYLGSARSGAHEDLRPDAEISRSPVSRCGRACLSPWRAKLAGGRTDRAVPRRLELYRVVQLAGHPGGSCACGQVGRGPAHRSADIGPPMGRRDCALSGGGGGKAMRRLAATANLVRLPAGFPMLRFTLIAAIGLAG